MKTAAIPRLRVRNLRLGETPLETAAEVVAWHGAVQAQDYTGARWSLAQRTTGLSAADVDAALASGDIIRTHVLRPTWHFLARDDARTFLGLTGPRILRGLAGRHRELGLDARMFAKAQRVIVKAIANEGPLTRKALGAELTKARIDVSGQRLPHLLTQGELDLVLCSGPWDGTDNTYVVLDDQVPPAPSVDQSDAVRMLVDRYLASHGPAAIADMQWWGGLKASEIRTALDELDASSHDVDGIELWWLDGDGSGRAKPEVRLLETYDEYIVGYTRSRFLGDANRERAVAEWRDRSKFGNVVMWGSTIIGGWRRSKRGLKVEIDVGLYGDASKAVVASLKREARRYGDFNGWEVSLQSRHPETNSHT